MRKATKIIGVIAALLTMCLITLLCTIILYRETKTCEDIRSVSHRFDAEDLMVEGEKLVIYYDPCEDRWGGIF